MGIRQWRNPTMASFRCTWLYAMELLPTMLSIKNDTRPYPEMCSCEPSVRESSNGIIHSDARSEQWFKEHLVKRSNRLGLLVLLLLHSFTCLFHRLFLVTGQLESKRSLIVVQQSPWRWRYLPLVACGYYLPLCYLLLLHQLSLADYLAVSILRLVW
jgi:hypothetical protein